MHQSEIVQIKTNGSIDVTADAKEDFTIVVVNGSASGKVAVSLSPAVVVLKNSTTASIGSDGTLEGADVTVRSTDHLRLLGIGGGAAISAGGTAGVGCKPEQNTIQNILSLMIFFFFMLCLRLCVGGS